jgi:hypothetical protein
MIEVADFLSVAPPPSKSHFFVIYFRGVTLADGMGMTAGVYSRRKLCYNTPNESEEIV